jgi:hypothetical protein
LMRHIRTSALGRRRKFSESESSLSLTRDDPVPRNSQKNRTRGEVPLGLKSTQVPDLLWADTFCLISIGMTQIPS